MFKFVTVTCYLSIEPVLIGENTRPVDVSCNVRKLIKLSIYLLLEHLLLSVCWWRCQVSSKRNCFECHTESYSLNVHFNVFCASLLDSISCEIEFVYADPPPQMDTNASRNWDQCDLSIHSNCVCLFSYFFVYRCSGRSICLIHASSSIFGDPCPTTSKYLEVHYRCSSGKGIITNQ